MHLLEHVGVVMDDDSFGLDEFGQSMLGADVGGLGFIEDGVGGRL